MTEPAKKNNNGIKAVGGVAGVLFILTCLAFLYGAVEPMAQRIEFQERQLEILRAALQTHGELNDHPWGVMIQVGQVQEKINEKFAEVETQFEALGYRVAQHEDWYDKWVGTMPGEQATQNERLKGLERIVFQDHPALTYRVPEIVTNGRGE